MNKLILVDDPFFVVNFYGRLDEGFQPGMFVVLIDRKKQVCHRRSIRKVFDQGNGFCLIDIDL